MSETMTNLGFAIIMWGWELPMSVSMQRQVYKYLVWLQKCNLWSKGKLFQ